ncbi:receptor-type tyrosine-protein phosphatase delta-like [Neodiprion pinetum]|uniref:receptor-type tyrosine-protein phosphatase delta-like n=1 Tax=Neodiprion pinetum TaxID=441929 RepID=UPI001EE09A86|nr:receptor-type tyrosine-protein phosphatase delta-like [Neodiprion pinetum]
MNSTGESKNKKIPSPYSLKWVNQEKWIEVDSIEKPMGPVFDYRWEGFKDFQYNSRSTGLQLVRNVTSFGTLVFSTRGSKKLGLFLCGRDGRTTPCIWFDIETNKMSILTCDKKPAGISTDLSKWQNITIESKKTKITKKFLDPYEWQTFKIKWRKNDVKVFNNNNQIIHGNHSYNLTELLVAGLESSVRFHHYTYYRTEKTNAQMFTSQFNLTDGNFCIDTIIGMCSECKLNFSIVEETYREPTEYHLKTIYGNQDGERNGLVNWRPIKLHKSFPPAERRLLKLKITTVLDNEDNGRWAIDPISHKCAPQGQQRESTIEIRKENSPHKKSPWPMVKCQQLFYHKNVTAIVNPWSSKPYINIPQLDQIISERRCGGDIRQDSDKPCSICNPNGCICSGGFNCSGECRTVSKIFDNCDLRCQRPGLRKPQILTFTPLGHGIVTLSWTHPEYIDPSITIEKFRFIVKLLNTDLLSDSYNRPVIPKDYVVRREQEVYQKEFRLTASSHYEISVVSVSQCNIDVVQEKLVVPVESDIGFASGEKPEVKCNGTDIELRLPAVINATRNTTIQVNFSKCDLYQSQRTSEDSSNTERKYQVEDSESKSFVIRGNQIANSSKNCSESLIENCQIKVTVHDWISGKSVNIWIDKKLTNESGMWYLILIIPVVLILAILAVLMVLWRRRRRRNILITSSADDINFIAMSESPKIIDSSKFPITSKYTPPSQISAPNQNSEIEYAVPQEFNSQSIDLKFFEAETRYAITSGKLRSQFMILPGGLTKSCEYGRLPENMPKNRNRNVIAYDDTRVILKKLPGDPYSDYINANYVKGYQSEKGYIATQGPTANTVNDFWRMIWQEKVYIICMLTNLIENGQTKCEEYWPPVGTKIRYGNVAVTTLSHDVFADYTFRALRVACQKFKRRVMHLHYTGWPADGIPAYCQSLVAYLKKLQTTDLKYGPVVVHCSAGDGRTGTLILCDICLSEAMRMGKIDVSAVLSRIRESRADMVENLEQYLLAHIIMVESIVSLPTQIPCDEDLPNGIKKLRGQLATDVQRLNDAVWQECALRSLAATPNQSGDDKLTSELSDELFIGFERTPSFNRNVNHRIRAVPVDGVKMRRQYLASWLPSTSNVANFWKSIAEMEIELIIILQRPDPNDTTCCDFTPSKMNLTKLIPYLRIVTQESQAADDKPYTFEKFRLIDTLEEEAKPQFVTVLTCTGWGYGRKGNPPAPEALVSLWTASERIPRKKSPTLVLCHDGVTACGLYLAMSFLLERMAVERECDVISAVRAVRRSRRQFVQSMDQIEYLYDAALNYYEGFATYANFS